MPVFDYECLACQHKFTEIVDLRSKSNPKCPKCKSKKTKKIFNFVCKVGGKGKVETKAESLAVAHAILDNLVARTLKK